MASCEGSSQKGYTLIELLVVVGIVVALAAVIVPLVVQFSGAGERAAEAAEWDAVQSAVDTMMADNQLSTVSASTNSTRITDNLDWDASLATVTLAAYTRDTITTYCYEWTATGRITAQSHWDTSTSPASCSGSTSPPPPATQWYLHNNPTPPAGDTASQAVLPIDLTSPTAVTLYDYSTDHSNVLGVDIHEGGAGPGESDLANKQVWRTAPLPGAVSMTGTVTITLWASIKNYQDNKAGGVVVYLRDYDGITYTEIGNGTVFKANWQGGSSTFVQETITISGLSYTIPVGNMLEVEMNVTANSDDKMWIAYDTSSYATKVEVP